MRRVFVGDIQGCRAELEDLLEAVGFQEGADVLHPVGDLVRKGPDSRGVLDLCMRLDAQPVLGNHDLRYIDQASEDPQQLWLKSQPLIRVFPDLVMVHAGLHPQWTDADLERMAAGQIGHPTDVSFLVTVRFCDAEGRQPPADWPPPGPPFRPWHEFYRGERRVVFGHWARQGLFQTDRVIGLDTGCCYGKQLTAWIAEEERIVQVDARAGD